MGYIKKYPIERNVNEVIFEDMCQFRFSVSFSISVSRDLFGFVSLIIINNSYKALFFNQS